MIIKKVLFIFVIAFILNAIWENLHSLLYDNYMFGQISEFILLRASLTDAIIIMIITLPFVLFPVIKRFSWIIIPVGFTISIVIEMWALGTERWAYNNYMPLIPLLSVGLTPILQLGLLGYLSYKITELTE